MLILISIVKMVITRVTRFVLEHIHCKVFIRFSVHKFFVEIITDDDRLKSLTDNQGLICSIPWFFSIFCC